jgi:hypothetical protein
MKKFTSTVLIACVLIALLAVPASTQDKKQDLPGVKIVNDTGYTIYSVYMVPITAREWGKDLLGDAVLLSGQSVNIKLSYPLNVVNRYNIALVDEDGDAYIRWDEQLQQVIPPPPEPPTYHKIDGQPSLTARSLENLNRTMRSNYENQLWMYNLGMYEKSIQDIVFTANDFYDVNPDPTPVENNEGTIYYQYDGTGYVYVSESVFYLCSSGKPVGYVENGVIFSFGGSVLGFYERSFIYDKQGYAVGAPDPGSLGTAAGDKKPVNKAYKQGLPEKQTKASVNKPQLRNMYRGGLLSDIF